MEILLFFSLVFASLLAVFSLMCFGLFGFAAFIVSVFFLFAEDNEKRKKANKGIWYTFLQVLVFGMLFFATLLASPFSFVFLFLYVAVVWLSVSLAIGLLPVRKEKPLIIAEEKRI